MMRGRLVFLLAVSLVWGSVPVLAQETPVPPPVVVELFSSQACTYCPPADAYLGELIQNPGVIGLSCHVDYFGKGASLGKRFCTERQTGYIKKMKLKAHYTPQMVINGHFDAVGYETGKVSAAILKGRAEKIDRVEIARQGGELYSFSLNPRQLNGYPHSVWLAIFDQPHDEMRRDGRKGARNHTYYNVVSRMNNMGVWDGAPRQQTVSPFLESGNGGFAILVQNDVTGAIIAAGAIYNQ